MKYGPGGDKVYYGASYAMHYDLDAESKNMRSYDTARLGTDRRFQTAAMTVVWIIKVK